MSHWHTGIPEETVAWIRERLRHPDAERLWRLADGLRMGIPEQELHDLTGIDPWFLYHMKDIIACEDQLVHEPRSMSKEMLQELKRLGFSDHRLAVLSGVSESDFRRNRLHLNVRTTFKRVDTCGAEFVAQTPYLYSTYESTCEARPTGRQKVMILGGGPNRIGQGIEFDYCCVHAAMALREMGYETIMVNCNPETVSTDYDTSDRLYFEPLTIEDVLNIVEVERQNGDLLGLVVQFGGQTPLKLALPLEQAHVPILGTSPDAIDRAEDRERFKVLVDKLGLRQPASGTARSFSEAAAIASSISYPIMVRPSYVLGGRAMEIIYDEKSLKTYITQAIQVSSDHPVLIDKYLEDAIEIDVDALSDGKTVVLGGIMEHIEEAGVHSGDSACSLPPYSLTPQIIVANPATDEGARVGASRDRIDEYPVCSPRRHRLRARGEPTRVPYRTVRQQGYRRAPSKDRHASDDGPYARRVRLHIRANARVHLGEGSGVSVQQVSGYRCDPRTGDALYRRGHGHRG